LASLQAAVGGLIAFGTELKSGDVLYVDDEALLKLNPTFFRLGKRLFAGYGLLVGPGCPLITDVVSTIEEITATVCFNVGVDLEEILYARSTTFNSADDFLEYLRRQREAERD
jgi:hypothetical protein